LLLSTIAKPTSRAAVAPYVQRPFSRVRRRLPMAPLKSRWLGSSKSSVAGPASRRMRDRPLSYWKPPPTQRRLLSLYVAFRKP
jgi:hypothetical protein